MAADIDILDQIADKLHTFCQRLSMRNQAGLFDLSRQAEDILCRILNLVYGWQLVNLNRDRPFCPAVDLADASRRICVQVTAAKSTSKATNTLRLLESHFRGQYTRVILFYLQGKPQKPQSSTVSGYQLELWDMGDLMPAIRDCAPTIQQTILEYMHMVDDAGILGHLPDLTRPNRWFTPSKTVQEDPVSGQALVCYQRQRVRLTAFLPRSPDGHLSCMIEFARRDTGGSHITFDQQIVLKQLFPGHHAPIPQRGFVVAVDVGKDAAVLQLGNSRYVFDMDTTGQLCALLDMLQEEHAASQAQIAALLGMTAFTVPPEDDWVQPLCRMPPGVWDNLWIYAQAHDALLQAGHTDLFDPCVPASVIRILKSPGPHPVKGIVAELHKRDTADGCVVSWHRGTCPDCPDGEGFDNRTKWRADYTLDWLLGDWLPRLADELYGELVPYNLRTHVRRMLGRVPSPEVFTQNVLDSVSCFR